MKDAKNGSPKGSHFLLQKDNWVRQQIKLDFLKLGAV